MIAGFADLIAVETGLRAEHAAGALLAGEAVADGDAHGLALRRQVKLSAAA